MERLEQRSFIGTGHEGLALARTHPQVRLEVFVSSWDDVDATRLEAARRGLEGRVRVRHLGAAGVLERRRASGKAGVSWSLSAPAGLPMRRA